MLRRYDGTMSDLGHQRADYGAADLKRLYNKHLAVAFATSVILHALVALPFIDQSEPDQDLPRRLRLPDLPRVDTTWTEITVAPPVKNTGHEGGGSPESNEPVGHASKGRPDVTPDRSHDRPDPNRNTIVKNPDRIHVVKNEPKPPHVAGNTRDTSKPSNTVGSSGQNTHGVGDRPAGGSGGVGVGFGVIGSRGWLVKPRASYPSGSTATGTVTLRFTVLPNGDITNITPVKRADHDLVNAAVSGLRRAKARPLPDGVDQIAQTYVIPFKFGLE